MAIPSSHETRIDLLRHGEPVGGRRYRGKLDDPLSETGWQQMWEAVGETPRWQQIVTSPLQRCRAFADAFAGKHTLPVYTEPRFREVGFGIWEGRTGAELDELIPGQVARFLGDPVNARPPGAEPLEEFVARVVAGFEEMLTRFSGQSILVVAHAGVIRVILAHVLEVPPTTMYRIHVANAAICRIRTDRDRTYSFLSHG